MAASSSSSPFFGYRQEDLQSQIKLPQQLQLQKPLAPPSSSMPSSSATVGPSAPPAKKKRNLPGTPNPDAEVIALSPKTLLATNRFICEVCNKGFQREQNLQLHRRGHNLPWKLKQKSTKEVRRKVYLCPEPACVHHDPSRALGDLTGIKKHYCRKHGEKKWKCDKCSKRYAVQSDWKAHSKICGTREYRCDCGTLFSRRDSFITHRAFCDALAQETARLPTGLTTPGGHLYSNNSIPLSLPNLGTNQLPSPELLRLGGGATAADPAAATASQLDHLIASSSFCPSNPGQSPGFLLASPTGHDHFSHPDGYQKPFNATLLQLPENTPTSNLNNNNSLFNLINNNANISSTTNQSSHLLMGDHQFPNNYTNNNNNQLMSGAMATGAITSLYNPPMQNEPVLPQMSATALLQRAAQMGSTTSGIGGSCGVPVCRGFTSSSSSSGSAKPTSFRAGCFMGDDSHLQGFMNTLQGSEGGYVGLGPGFHDVDEGSKLQRSLRLESLGGSDGLTRDFLGVGGVVRSMGDHHQQQHHHHHGLEVGPFDPEMKPGNLHRSFRVGNLQR